MELPSNVAVQAKDDLDIATLVAYLRSAGRDRPVAILTVARERHLPYVDADSLAREFSREADIVVLPDAHLTHLLSDSLAHQGAGVYGGACRVYPPGTDWEQHPHRVPLRLVRSPDNEAGIVALIRDDLRTALTAAARPAPTPAPTRPMPAPPARPAPKPTTPATLARTAPRPPNPTALTRPHAPAPPAPPTPGPHEVSSAVDADRLAAYLLSAGRARPTVVVTRGAGMPAAHIDVAELRDDLAGLADIFEITNAAASWEFGRAMPDMCQVYGGASRVYPVGLEWTGNPYLSPLRFAYGPSDRADVTRLLTSDALSMAASGGLSLSTRPSAAAQPRRVTGEVTGIVAGRALVQLVGDPAGLGVVWPELVVAAREADCVFAKGMRIEGIMDPESKRIDVDEMRRTPAEALAAYQPGDTILSRVTEVRPDGCTVELFPGVTQRIEADNLVSDGTDVRLLMAVGEVLRMWFAGLDEDEWVLSLLDVGPPEGAIAAPSILRGGPPWLVLATPGGPEKPPRQGPVADLPSDGDVAAEDAVELVKDLRRENAQLATILREREQSIANSDEQLRELRSKLRAAERTLSSRWSAENLFESDHDRLDFEIRTAWAHMTTPSEKRDLPLARWSYGPDFFATLTSVQGIKRDKIVEVLVHVLTGRDTELASRERHQLRAGAGGDDPTVTRAGGETCWRVSLQVKTPSARRLHYWLRNDGTVEFASIRLHDDFRP